MKNQICLILTLFIVLNWSTLSFGQDNHENRKKGVYTTWIVPMDNSSEIRGYLVEVGDDALILSNGSKTKIDTVDISNIKEIHFRKKGKVEKGILIGGGAGLLSGLGVGIGIYDGPSASLGLLSMMVGVVAGGGAGMSRVKISINGTLGDKRAELMTYIRTFPW